MKNLIYILIMSFGLSTQAQNIKVRLIDTVEKYQANINRLEETQDCTVRAIAEGFNLEYLEARRIALDMGRENGEGITLRLYIYGLINRFHKQIIFSSNLQTPMKAEEFVNNIAESGFTYIVISRAHTFVVEQNYRNLWYVKGNYDDLEKDILMYVKIKNQYGN